MTWFLKGYGKNDASEAGDFLRFTGMNKIPTISECYAHFYPNERGAPRPSSINETKPSKTLINFKYSLLNLKSFK